MPVKLLVAVNKLIPLAVGRSLSQLWEIALGSKSIDRLHIHEQPATNKIDPHLDDADLPQADDHFWPRVAMVSPVAVDDVLVILEHQRHSVGLQFDSLNHIRTVR